MKILIGILIPIFLASCSFKAQNDQATQQTVFQSPIQTEIEDPTFDSDGDGMANGEERKIGRNPFIADIPDLKVRFLQNYKLELQYVDLTASSTQASLSIDTKIGALDPDFKYRVGRVFIRDLAYKTASMYGRYSGHSSGEITTHDFSWVKYPDVDPRFFHKKVRDFRNVISMSEYNRTPTNISATLENSVQLLPNRNFDSISNLVLSFYYYDYEKESYELLASKKIERHFNAGVTETFEVKLENLPIKLLSDNYLKKGEFIISEVTDYEIPSQKTTYKQLMASIKNKTIPVSYNAPLETKISYLAVPEKGRSFQSIMQILFDKGFTIEDDKLLKVGQFENNLPDFTYLKELADKDKLGKWFIFTNPLEQGLLDHQYILGDSITLSYVTGSELAGQSEEKVYSYAQEVSSGRDYTLIPLGNITPNSKVDFLLRGDKVIGTKLEKEKVIIDTQDSSCGTNCISLGKYCKWDIVLPYIFSAKLNFKKDFSGDDVKQLFLVVNDKEFPLTSLYSEKKILGFFEDENIHITIPDISKIIELKNFDENQLFLKIATLTDSTFTGIKLSEVGRFWDGAGGCPFLTPAIALDRGAQISNESIWLDKIQYAHKNAIRPEYQSRITYSDRMTTKRILTVSISSTINNFFN